MRPRGGRALLALGALGIAAGCKTSAGPEPGPPAKPPPSANALLVPWSSYDFQKNPKLLERILRSPHGYYRFINVPFSNEVCRRFTKEIKMAPTVNLHGDAHIEQYAVTDLGRGLTDFDDSSSGPALIDLVRFGVSLRLACVAHGWEDRAEELFERFLTGYKVALKQPEHQAEEPSLANGLRARFKADRARYFDWIDSIMEPVEKGTKAALVAAMKPYVENMLQQEECSQDFFNIISVGNLKMGIGSALDQKFLVRVQGPTEAPADDVVLEVKEVRDLSGIECVRGARASDPFRILVGQSRIAYKPYRFLGYVRLQDKMFWIHSWVDNYAELNIERSFSDVQQLEEVVYDVGVQLGQGHVKKIAEPLGHQLRSAQLRLVEQQEEALKRAVKALTQETISAWERFKQQASEEKVQDEHTSIRGGGQKERGAGGVR